MRQYRKPSEIKLISMILAGSDIITGTPEYKRLMEISKSYLANTLIVASPAADMIEEYKKLGLDFDLSPAADLLEEYTDRLCMEVNECGYRSDCWKDWSYDYEEVVRVYEEMLRNEDY